MCIGGLLTLIGGLHVSCAYVDVRSGWSPHIASWGSHWSPGGTPGGSARTRAHGAATVARAGANARLGAEGTSRWSPGGTPGGSARARASRAATSARTGANATPGAEGSGPGLPACAQQGVAGIDQQQSTERHHGHEHHQGCRHQLLPRHHLHGCLLLIIFSSFSARREPLPDGE